MTDANIFRAEPYELGSHDLDAYAEGRTSALQGNERNPYPPESHGHEAWDLGFKDGTRLTTIMWHGILDPYGENPYAADGLEGVCHAWYERGQRLALAIGQDQLEVVLGRLPH